MKNNSEEVELNTCGKCSKIIPFGQKYFSIVKSFEQYVRETPTSEAEIEVDEAIEVVALCEDCGICFNEENLAAILKALPIRGQEGRN